MGKILHSISEEKFHGVPTHLILFRNHILVVETGQKTEISVFITSSRQRLSMVHERTNHVVRNLFLVNDMLCIVSAKEIEVINPTVLLQLSPKLIIDRTGHKAL